MYGSTSALPLTVIWCLALQHTTWSPATPMTRLMKSLPVDGAMPIALPMSWKNRSTGLLGAVNGDSFGQPGGRLNTTTSPRRGSRKS